MPIIIEIDKRDRISLEIRERERVRNADQTAGTAINNQQCFGRAETIEHS